MSGIARTTVYSLAAVVLLIGSAITSQAQVYNCTWDASADKLPDEDCPPWELTKDGLFDDPYIVDGYLLLNTGTNTDNLLVYRQADGQLDLPVTWTIEFEVKYESGVITGGSYFRTPCAVVFGVGGKYGNALFIGPNEIFVLASELVKGPSTGPPNIPRPDADFQKYRIEVDVSGSSTASTFRVYVNDIQQWTSETLQTFYRGSVPFDRWLSWGDPTRNGSGETRWHYLRHDGYSGALIVENNNDDGYGSLRQAIVCANEYPGPNTITFDVPGPITIMPASVLPALNDPSGGTTISGEVNAIPRSVVVDGTNLTPYSTGEGLIIASDNNIISDLVVTNFWINVNINGSNNRMTGCHVGVGTDGITRATFGNGVNIIGNANIIGGRRGIEGNTIAADSHYTAVNIGGDMNVVAGNNIGTDASGDGLLTPPRYLGSIFGVAIYNGNGNRIGGLLPDSGNVICDHTYDGITLKGDGNVILYNYIGVGASGATAIPNGSGIRILDASNANYIGNSSGAGNVISGNNEYGINLYDATNTEIYGNKIGVDASGVNAIPNARGIITEGGGFNNIGDGTPGGGNIVSGNTGFGIAIIYSSNNTILGNTIGANSAGDDLGNGGYGIAITGTSYFLARLNTLSQNIICANGGLGIDLGNDGVTANDGGDGDEGPNDLLNFPENMTALDNEDGTFTISGTAAGDAVVEFFVAHPAGDPAAKPADPSGHGEAYEYIGFTTASPAGDFTFTTPAIDPYTMVTATATDGPGNTSEFSANIELAPKPMSASSHCPINMIMEDPDLLRVGCDSLGNLINEIPGAEYHQDPDDSIFIPDPKPGTYTLYFVREAGTSEDDSLYSTVIRVGSLPPLVVAVNRKVPGYGVMHSFAYNYEEGFHYLNGDANRDGQVNVGDAVYVINYVFRSGEPPSPVPAGDANCDGEANVGDAVKIINYVFRGGDPPCYLAP